MFKRTNKMNDEQTQIERLNSEVRMDGKGEHPAVQKLLSDEFADMSNYDAGKIAQSLHQLVRGMENMQQVIQRMDERMNKLDAANEKWEKDREEFFEEVVERANSLVLSEEKRDELRAREGKRLQEEIQKARANRSVEALAFKANLDQQPKEIIISPGRLVTVNDRGVVKQVVVPERIRIKNSSMEWILQPGVPTEVPKLVAELFRERQRDRTAMNERKAILNAKSMKEADEVAQKFDNVRKDHKQGGDSFASFVR